MMETAMELLERFTRGEIEAFETLFQRHQADVYRWVVCLGVRHRSGSGRTPIRAPTVREGLRHTRLLHGGGNPSLTVGALMGVFPTLGFSRLTGIWANPSLLCRAPSE